LRSSFREFKIITDVLRIKKASEEAFEDLKSQDEGHAQEEKAENKKAQRLGWAF